MKNMDLKLFRERQFFVNSTKSITSFLNLAILVCLSMALFSCGDKQKHVPPKKEKVLGSINFYIETSASMGGYFKREAEFKAIISDLTSKIENNIIIKANWKCIGV
jgi:hypothetical protein